MKKFFEHFLKGISIGCTIGVVVFLLIWLISGEETISMPTREFSTHVIGSMLVGLGFYLPSAIYENEKLAMWLRVLIHMGVGFIVFFIVASVAGWIPAAGGPGAVILYVLLVFVISMLIWAGHNQHYACEAKKINAQLKKQQE